MTATRTEAGVWQEYDLVRAALDYATDVHRHDLRKGDLPIPYVAHLWSVAALVLEHGGDDAQAAAGLLHDSAEDHGGRGRLDDLEVRFGPDVATLVEALSDSLVGTGAGEVKEGWVDRKARYLDHLGHADRRVKLVSACDKLHNARAIRGDHRRLGPPFWDRFTQADPVGQLWYYRGLVERLAPPEVPGPLAEELAQTVETLATDVGAYVPDLDARVAAFAKAVEQGPP